MEVDAKQMEVLVTQLRVIQNRWEGERRAILMKWSDQHQQWQTERASLLQQANQVTNLVDTERLCWLHELATAHQSKHVLQQELVAKNIELKELWQQCEHMQLGHDALHRIMQQNSTNNTTNNGGVSPADLAAMFPSSTSSSSLPLPNVDMSQTSGGASSTPASFVTSIIPPSPSPGRPLPSANPSSLSSSTSSLLPAAMTFREGAGLHDIAPLPMASPTSSLPLPLQSPESREGLASPLRALAVAGETTPFVSSLSSTQQSFPPPPPSLEVTISGSEGNETKAPFVATPSRGASSGVAPLPGSPIPGGNRPFLFRSPLSTTSASGAPQPSSSSSGAVAAASSALAGGNNLSVSTLNVPTSNNPIPLSPMGAPVFHAPSTIAAASGGGGTSSGGSTLSQDAIHQASAALRIHLDSLTNTNSMGMGMGMISDVMTTNDNNPGEAPVDIHQSCRQQIVRLMAQLRHATQVLTNSSFIPLSSMNRHTNHQ
jgi:hypothetical protein